MPTAHLIPARVTGVPVGASIRTICQYKLDDFVANVRVVGAIIGHGVLPLHLHQSSSEVGLHLTSNVRYLLVIGVTIPSVVTDLKERPPGNDGRPAQWRLNKLLWGR